jgi:hypothetical protein
VTEVIAGEDVNEASATECIRQVMLDGDSLQTAFDH